MFTLVYIKHMLAYCVPFRIKAFKCFNKVLGASEWYNEFLVTLVTIWGTVLLFGKGHTFVI